MVTVTEAREQQESHTNEIERHHEENQDENAIPNGQSSTSIRSHKHAWTAPLETTDNLANARSCHGCLEECLDMLDGNLLRCPSVPVDGFSVFEWSDVAFLDLYNQLCGLCSNRCLQQSAGVCTSWSTAFKLSSVLLLPLWNPQVRETDVYVLCSRCISLCSSTYSGEVFKVVSAPIHVHSDSSLICGLSST
jgi:hypothetical protein